MLEDLGISPIVIDTQVLWELQPFRYDLAYQEHYGEYEDPLPPPHISTTTNF